MDTYQILKQRINQASKDQLPDLVDKITKHYQNGTISVGELEKLDVLIMERKAEFEP